MGGIVLHMYVVATYNTRVHKSMAISCILGRYILYYIRILKVKGTKNPGWKTLGIEYI